MFQTSEKEKMNLESFIEKQRDWSIKTFGPISRPGRCDGIIEHIYEELQEIKDNPKDLTEWIDLILLALDGANVNGFTPKQIIKCLEQKQQENIFEREWPDWKFKKPGEHINHVRKK